MPNRRSKEYSSHTARGMGQFVRPPRPRQPLDKDEIAIAMKSIAARATSLLVEVDALLSEVEDFAFLHGPHWKLGKQGTIYYQNLEKLNEWSDFIREIGEDSLSWG